MTKTNQILADIHVHTEHSHDSRCTAEQCALAAIDRGISVITITDHCDVSFCRNADNYENARLSAKIARLTDEKLGERISVLAGIELGDCPWNPALAKEIAAWDEFDVILGSIHSVPYKNYGMPFSCVNFDGWKADDLIGFINRYFDEIDSMLQNLDFNILSHLTIPLRYINGRYGHEISAELFYDRIESILREIISRGISLEVNTSTYTSMNSPMPDAEILKMYKSLGGRLISLGSDAHIPTLVGSNFPRALNLLKSCGFDSYVYMKNKRFISVDII